MWRRKARNTATSAASTDTSTDAHSKTTRAGGSSNASDRAASVIETRVARHLEKRAQAERPDRWDTLERARAPRRWPMVVAAVATVCIVAGATVLAMAPASWVASAIAQGTQGRVGLANAQGSLWQGSANLMLSTGTGSGDTGPASEQSATLLPNRIHWHTRFWPLFQGHIQMVMQEARPLSQPILIDAGWQSTTVFAGSLGVPASLLVGLGAPFNTLDLQGDVTLDWTDWRILGRGRSALAYGQLTVDLQNMSSSVSRVSPLGSYRSTFNAQGPDATLAVTTVSGPLILNGQGRLQGTQFSFDGSATSTPAAHDNLAGLLNLLGRRTDDNTVALSFMR